MAEADPLFLRLHKIPPATSEESLEEVLQALWRTRKTGFGSSDKARIRSLLNVPSLQELDPVLACLRLIIRKFVHEGLTGDDIMKLFPFDLSNDLQGILVMLLLKYQDQWKEEASKDKPLWRQTRVSRQAKVQAPPVISKFRTSELLSSWPRHDHTSYQNSNNHDRQITGYANPTLPPPVPMSCNEDDGSLDNLENIPRLKSMTWTMENWSSAPGNRVAIITLKLQDYTKSSSGETEVKFQLSKDTLEAMLRSMACISEKFSNSALPTSEPSSKKQRS